MQDLNKCLVCIKTNKNNKFCWSVYKKLVKSTATRVKSVSSNTMRLWKLAIIHVCHATNFTWQISQGCCVENLEPVLWLAKPKQCLMVRVSIIVKIMLLCHQTSYRQ